MTSNEKGDIGESIAMAEAMKRGYRVFIPLSKNIKCDFVVDRNEKLEKVQVKTVTPKNGGLDVSTRTNLYSKEYGRNNRNRSVKYQKGDFDWLIVVNELTWDCLFVPADRVLNRSEFRIRIEPSRQSSRINHVNEFKEW